MYNSYGKTLIERGIMWLQFQTEEEEENNKVFQFFLELFFLIYYYIFKNDCIGNILYSVINSIHVPKILQKTLIPSPIIVWKQVFAGFQKNM